MNRFPSTVLITSDQAAALLGVSPATLRNWRRAGYLALVGNRPPRYARTAVQELAEAIRANRFPRLRSRANKTAAGRVGARAFGNADLASAASALLPMVESGGLDTEAALFLATLRWLAGNGECDPARSAGPAGLVSIGAWRRPVIGQIIQDWRRRLTFRRNDAAWKAAAPFAGIPADGDPVGRLYECLSPAGDKAGRGAFFTPDDMVEDAMAGLGGKPAVFLDPCCGSGRFLLAAVKRFDLGPGDLYGFDNDPIAVDIARLNLLLRFPRAETTPNIQCRDFLRDPLPPVFPATTTGQREAFAAVATNPPWGAARRAGKAVDPGKTGIESGETFSLFLERSLALLPKGGRLAFILPESILRTRTHADVRGLVLAEAKIRRIVRLAGRFPGVLSPVIRLDLEKGDATPEWRVEVNSPSHSFTAEQRRFAANPGGVFDIDIPPRDLELLDRIRQAGRLSLRDGAEWALGIVTGDNGRLVLSAPGTGTEPVLRGRDILSYMYSQPQAHIVFAPASFQQCASERLYRAPEKLVYRFIAERPVFAYDDRRLLTLNSANILLPRLPGLPLLAVLALLNSPVVGFYHTRRHPGRKVLRSDLEALPLPGMGRKQASRMEALVHRRLAGDLAAAAEANRLTLRAFGLNEKDVKEYGG